MGFSRSQPPRHKQYWVYKHYFRAPSAFPSLFLSYLNCSHKCEFVTVLLVLQSQGVPYFLPRSHFQCYITQIPTQWMLRLLPFSFVGRPHYGRSSGGRRLIKCACTESVRPTGWSTQLTFSTRQISLGCFTKVGQSKYKSFWAEPLCRYHIKIKLLS